MLEAVARQRRTRPGLAHLKRAVDAAVAATHTPPTPRAASWPFTFPQQHLAPDDARRIWDVVRYMRRDHRRLYRQFLSQWTIYDFVVDYLHEADNPTLADLVSELDERAGQDTTGLVDIPLLNVVLPRETVPLGKRAMLVRTDHTRRAGRRFGPYLDDIWAVKRNLGDELTPRNRWLQASGSREVSSTCAPGSASASLPKWYLPPAQRGPMIVFHFATAVSSSLPRLRPRAASRAGCARTFDGRLTTARPLKSLKPSPLARRLRRLSEGLDGDRGLPRGCRRTIYAVGTA
jgi:hypothetical protein